MEKKFVDVKPGQVYNCFVNAVKVGETKTGKPRLSFYLKVADGECKDGYLFWHITLGTEGSVKFAAYLLKKLAACTDYLADVEAITSWVSGTYGGEDAWKKLPNQLFKVRYTKSPEGYDRFELV